MSEKVEVSESIRDCVNTTQDDVINRSIQKTLGFELLVISVLEFGVSESLRDCVNTFHVDVSNRWIPKTARFDLIMKSVREFGVSESLRDYVNTTQDDVSNRSIAKTAGFELMMKSVGKIRIVRITSGLGEYYSARCGQSIDTKDSGVRAHDGKFPENAKCPNHFGIA